MSADAVDKNRMSSDDSIDVYSRCCLDINRLIVVLTNTMCEIDYKLQKLPSKDYRLSFWTDGKKY